MKNMNSTNSGYAYGVRILRHLREELAWATDKQLWVISNLKQLAIPQKTKE